MAQHPSRVTAQLRRRLRRGLDLGAEVGQTALIAVVALTVIASSIGGALVLTVVRSFPLQQAAAVQIYAHRAMEAGANAYLTAINANPSLAQCSTNTNGSGLCTGINYGKWNKVANSDVDGADPEYYAFGNPQPKFDSTTNALDSLTVQVVGAARDKSTTNNYLFDQETLTVTPSNGFLDNVWWSNFESYSATGNYSNCNYNWNLSPTTYNIDNAAGSIGCSPVYFGPGDYLFGPVYTNDSVFVAGNGSASSSPSFGTTSSPSSVTTADPHCLFVDNSHGMSGSYTGSSACGTASGDVALYDAGNSSYGHAVEQPPATDAQLGTIAAVNGCLYSGPTQVTLSQVNGVGKMTVVSPDTPLTNSGTDANNLSTNTSTCPTNGTADLPVNGVVFVQNATSAQTKAWANPFDDPVHNSVTNLTSSPSSPTPGGQVTLTATVKSGSSKLDSGATVSFSQTTLQSGRTRTSVISGCSAQALSSVTQVTGSSPPVYQATATCSFTESTYGTGAFSATYSGGTYASGSSGNLGQTNTLSSSESYGPDAQVSAGGCNSCYYGETSTPDAEGDAFVNGALSGQLTIGTANDVIVDGPISYADCAGHWTTGQSGAVDFCPYFEGGTNDTLGLIADNYVEINRPVLASSSNSYSPTVLPPCSGTYAATCDPSDGTHGISIDAALLALTQSFVVNNWGDGTGEGGLNVYGSIQQYARGPVGTFNPSTHTVNTGYVKHYTWDPLLNFVSPPSYLVPSTPSWVLQGVQVNAGTPSTDVCPPLLPVYGSSQQVTQYCTASPGGLPDYPPITAPSPPTNVTATASLSGTITVSWTDPASDNGSPITGYSISPSPQCSGCTGLSVSGATATSTSISGLTPGTYYSFSVTATNGNGTSDPSNSSNSVTPPTAPGAPTGVSAVANSDGTVTVTWTNANNNGSPVTSYTVVASPTCSGCSVSYSLGSSTSSGRVSGLAAGSSYTFTVTATNGIGTSGPSAASNSVTTPTLPGVPTIGTATAGSGQATVTWTAPSSDGGSAITGYQVTPYVNGTAQTSLIQVFNSPATTESVTGLTTGTAYTFAVAAINGVGTGSNSAQSNAVTPATVPGAPTIGTLTRGATGSGQVTVNFTAPSSDGGSPVTGYTVTATDSRWWRGSVTASGSASPITVSGLYSGDTYTFTVTATNAIGTGPSSSSSQTTAP